jgi:hypothetical protein
MRHQECGTKASRLCAARTLLRLPEFSNAPWPALPGGCARPTCPTCAVRRANRVPLRTLRPASLGPTLGGIPWALHCTIARPPPPLKSNERGSDLFRALLADERL